MINEFRIGSVITPRNSNELRIYLNEVSQIPLLSIEEEVELAALARDGNQYAREKLITSNLRFVISIANQFQNQGIPYCDIISEGNIGLIKAVDHFDERRGFKFITYAVWWIRQSIMQSVADLSRTVRLPQNIVGLQNRLRRYSERYQSEHGREPSVEELAEMVGLSEERVQMVLTTMGKTQSLDAPLADGDDNTLEDVIANQNVATPDHELLRDSLRYDLEKALSVLSLREREIICKLTGFDGEELTMEEIAQEMGLTRERVRQVTQRAFSRLHQNSAPLLRKYIN